MLTPMHEENGVCSKRVKGCNNNVSFCSVKVFLKVHKHNGYCLALLPREARRDETRSVVPVEIQDILEEFKAIVAEEFLTNCLPCATFHTKSILSEDRVFQTKRHIE